MPPLGAGWSVVEIDAPGFELGADPVGRREVLCFPRLLASRQPLLHPARQGGINRRRRRQDVQHRRLRSEEHTSELQSPCNLVCRLLLEKKKKEKKQRTKRYDQILSESTTDTTQS